MFKTKLLTGLVAGSLLISVVGCGTSAAPNSSSNSQSPAQQQAVSLTGAGSTFVQPLIMQQIAEYAKTNPNVTINYQGVGSGAGIKQISDQTLDFGATDAFMTDSQLAGAKGGKILQIPLTLGAEAISYNLPGNPQNLKITPEVLTNIYLGKITKWNDPAITAENPGVSLPNLAITVAHRSDGSGTTSIFTHYLSAISPTWKSQVGAGTSVNWPVGVGGKGNASVAGIVQQTSGAIGYIELAYALQNNLPHALIKNQAGKWVGPSLESASAAAAAFQVPDDMRVNIVNAPGATAYPIAGFSWALIYQQQTDQAKATAMLNFLDYCIHDGQKLAPAMQYAPLPSNLASREEAMLKTVTYQGQPILK
ncbi:MAG: phosphate ABC transporter substrate-binding protein PstS [Peptococcaceae bacterium]|nr:phosphate ABC transporter substrate-binding protein PstS [Peptococcaceae bacterium]